MFAHWLNSPSKIWRGKGMQSIFPMKDMTKEEEEVEKKPTSNNCHVLWPSFHKWKASATRSQKEPSKGSSNIIRESPSFSWKIGWQPHIGSTCLPTSDYEKHWLMIQSVQRNRWFKNKHCKTEPWIDFFCFPVCLLDSLIQCLSWGECRNKVA